MIPRRTLVSRLPSHIAQPIVFEKRLLRPCPDLLSKYVSLIKNGLYKISGVKGPEIINFLSNTNKFNREL